MRLDIANLVSNSFNILGDLRETISVNFVTGTGSYDPATDTQAQTISTVSNLKVVFARFTIDEIDSSIVVETDMKVLIPALDIGTVQPKETDYFIENQTGFRWNVVKSRSVPGNSVYIIHVRKA